MWKIARYCTTFILSGFITRLLVLFFVFSCIYSYNTTSVCSRYNITISFTLKDYVQRGGFREHFDLAVVLSILLNPLLKNLDF